MLNVQALTKIKNKELVEHSWKMGEGDFVFQFKHLGWNYVLIITEIMYWLLYWNYVSDIRPWQRG